MKTNDTYRDHPQPQPPAVREVPSGFNKWFCSLAEGRQAVLRDYKWMLAHAAFEAGRQQHLLTWAELTEGQKEAARKAEYDELLRGISQGFITFPDGPIKEAIDKAWADAERMFTPRFFHEYLQESAGDLLMQLATTQAEQSMYLNPYSTAGISSFTLPQI